MGFIDSTPERQHFYNVVHAVGANCPNHRDNVMMIQYMLRTQYVGAKAALQPRGEMKVDGICGPITLNWILTYQKQLRMGGNSVLIDGRVDRIRDTSTFTGNISKTGYTIYSLNYTLWETNNKAYMELPMFVPVSNPALA